MAQNGRLELGLRDNIYDVTAEALRAKIDRKSAISLQRGQFDPKFQVEGNVPHQSFLHGQLGQ